MTADIRQFAFIIGGSPVPSRFRVTECVVENSLHLPDACAIRVEDPEYEWLDGGMLKTGTPVEIQASDGEGPLKTVFEGEIVALELELGGHSSAATTIRCLSLAHRLHRGRQRRSYQNVYDSDVVDRIAREVGLRASVKQTRKLHDWVFQNNQTNWEFLSLLAFRNGYRLFLKGNDELCYEPVKDQGDSEITLLPMEHLRSFRPRMSASPQVDEVIVRGWDPNTKRAVVGTWNQDQTSPILQGGERGGAASREAFGSARMVIVDRPVASQTEAEDIARSMFEEIAGNYVEAEGLCYGTPEIKPGTVVEVRHVGKRFSGRYYVTASTHTYTANEGYSTQFSVSGKRPTHIAQFLAGNSDSRRDGRLEGVAVAIVTDNSDPMGKGRVKVKYPWLTEDHESFWVRISSPMAGQGRGLFILPEIDDEVLVAFEHGDIHSAYIVGALWNGVDATVEKSGEVIRNKKVDRRVFKTRIGHTLAFDDKDGKGEVLLKTRSGHFVILNDEKDFVQISDRRGNFVKINAEDQSIELNCKGDLRIKATKSVTIDAGTEVRINATTSGQFVTKQTLLLKGPAAVNIQR